jgi:arylsulfatase A-like enzyme
MQDDQVKMLMNKLEDMGVADNTIFIYLADHGVEPGKAAAYEQGVHIPMIVK